MQEFILLNFSDLNVDPSSKTSFSMLHRFLSSATLIARRAERDDILPGFEPQFLSQRLCGIA